MLVHLSTHFLKYFNLFSIFLLNWHIFTFFDILLCIVCHFRLVKRLLQVNAEVFLFIFLIPAADVAVLPLVPGLHWYIFTIFDIFRHIFCLFGKEQGKGRAADGESVTSHASIRQKPWRAFGG